MEAMNRDGLTVESGLKGRFNVSAKATDDTASIGPVDLVIYTVKMYHNPGAIETIRPLVGPGTVILTLQNGIDNGDQLSVAFGKDRVMVGMAVVQARIEKPGVVAQLGKLGSVTFGEIDGGITPRGEELLKLFEKADWSVELTDNAMRALWRKFIYLTGSAEVNAATQITYGEMRTLPETRALIIDAWREIAEVARATGADIGDDIIEWCQSSLDSFAADGMTSLGNDFRAGRPVELDGLTGTVVKLGAEVGVATPIHSTIYALLKPAALRIESNLPS
jgi:2-dehydropantoate 2-reductase